VEDKRKADSKGPTTEGAKSPLPSISLPKGGGAIRGIGEKFGVNPATGTGSLSVPLASSPGRADFGPQLSLSYDSGSGNGPFGFGWSLSLPTVTRKTDKGLPRYLDGDESDVFILSGAEDLVPILDGTGSRISLPPRTVHGIAYTINLYRPRIEGLFARIERWTDTLTGISHWRTITRDNVTTIFGFDQNSRIYDPRDPRRVFSYLIYLTTDNKGNATRYEHLPENSVAVNRSAAHEANRTDPERATQRYLKYIHYGNIQPYFPDWSTGGADAPLPADWHFEIVLDYGDHPPNSPTPAPDRAWPVRPDPFSTYRAGFEVRTYRRCKRVLLFHNFPQEVAVGADCLVRSTDLLYSDEVNPVDPNNPIYTFLESVTQTGYRPILGGYDQRSTPPLEFFYSQPEIHPEVLTLADPDSRGNLPEGLDGARFRWADLNGEGLSGILTEQNGGWGYKRNLSPLNVVTLPDGERVGRAQFGPMEPVRSLPVPAQLGGGQQFLDITGHGRLDLAMLDGPAPGYFERTEDEDWEPLKTFPSLPRINWSEPNLQFVDLTGDGLSDVLITEDDVYTFYPSLGVNGFGEAERVFTPSDEERGPHVVLADGTQTVSLADMSGDGLRDLVRVRNGAVCYWPNLGYGRFGAKVTMDGSPRFIDEEHFDPRRVRLADVDGSGTTDLLYVGDDGVQVCFNRSGNSWAAKQRLAVFPGTDNLSSVQAMDLLGNGTACLVWSSPLPGESYAPLRYVDLMGSQKPHLMVRIRNNLGSETRLSYAPSTRFYLEDRLAGRSWVTRLPFPVQCVDRVETYDWIGRSRFVTRYAYHHGYFDGVEREFRGFGMVEQWDTEEHHDDTLFPDVETINEDAASFNPPVVTRTWFHTGVFFEGAAVSKQYAHEYWVEPAMRGDSPAAIAAREALLLPDSFLDSGLTGDEMREAFRALKGSALRIEVYGQDGSARAEHPYSVKEQNFTVGRVQPFGPNQHAVFLTHSREAVTYHYERQPDDPRVTHDLTLEVDEFGNVRRSVSVSYGRRAGYPEPEPNLSGAFRTMLAHDQTRLHIGATDHRFTDPVNQPTDGATFDFYRARMPSETITAELTGIAPATALFRFNEIDGYYTTLWDGTHDISYEDVSTPDIEGVGIPTAFARRIVEHSRTIYRSDDLTGLLPLGTVQSLALPGESYHLGLTTGLITRIFGTRVTDAILLEGGYVRLAGQNDWWIPSGRIFYSPGDADAPAQELAEARAHFYRVRRAIDPFGAIDRRDYDPYDLLPRTAMDAVGNVTTADIDYRVQHPFRTTDPNGNFSEVAYDCLGQVTGTAVRGKAGEGDSLAGFVADLTDAAIQAARNDPLNNPAAILGNATSRIVYDLFAYFRTRDQPIPDAPMLYTLTRETHVSDLAAGQTTRFQHVFVYWDGFGREAQHKAQAEQGPVPNVGDNVTPRWVGSGWTIYNNKGKPIRKYESFFSTTHHFEFNRQAGVSSVLFYDPTERVVATLHADSTFEKTVFNAWKEETWDPNDTVLISDPRTDADAGDFFLRLLGNAPGAFTSWYDRRIGGAWGNMPEEQAANLDAAHKTAAHAATPTVAHFDSLGRTCLSVADNGTAASIPQRYPTRTAMDTENKPLALLDPLGRRVMEMCLREPIQGGSGFRYVAGYDVAGNPLYRNGMDGGERHTLNNVAGNPIRHWDARGFAFRTVYDPLHRPTHRFVGPDGLGEILFERLIYGEKHPDAARNLKGKLFYQYDAAGLASHDRYDFKDNVLETGRQLAVRYTDMPDWSAIKVVADNPVLDLAALNAATGPLLVAAENFTSSSRFDALNRPIQTVTPHALGGRPSVIQPGYNEANLLERIDLWIRQANVPAALLDPATADVPAVANIDYNAHGQRIELDLGNSSNTTFAYDLETFRLTALTTTRPNASPDARTVQALAYTYDPKGNITRLRDSADIHNVVYFRNQRVDPTADYTYDAIYRLKITTGREHLGQTSNVLNAPRQVTNDDSFRTSLDSPGDGNAMGNYTERYVYDDAGNLLQMLHQVSSGNWTRWYSYAELSQITAAEVSNRLSATSRPGDNPLGPFSDGYQYDRHGNMTRMPHLPTMTWDPHDRLQSTTRQVVNAGTPEATYYAYDTDAQRVRKVTERQAAQGQTPTRKSEHLYLGPFEIYREYASDGTTTTLERETLHVLLDHRLVAMVETRTVGNAEQIVRYQYSNHLGSALLELSDQAAVISYEEYFPYGSTSYQAVRSQTETPKRYRYTGKERDEENDLDYHGARYCAPWLGRWISCDPAGLDDGPNLYMYVNGNPVALSDPTGMWGWREVAIVAAVVVVGVVVTVATAGVAGPIVAGAVASVGLSGAAATVATGVVVGAVAGAAGGAASELTRQVASGEEVSGRKIGQAALTGAAAGAVTGGLSSLGTIRQGAMAANAARASARGVGTYGRAVATSASHGAVGGGVAEGTRQLISGERLDLGRIATAAGTGAVIGGAVRAASPAVRPLISPISRVPGVGRVVTAPARAGIRLGRAAFSDPASGGRQAVENYAAALNDPVQQARVTGANFERRVEQHVQAVEGQTDIARQVTIRPYQDAAGTLAPRNTQVRADNLGRQATAIRLTDAKATGTAPFTPNQTRGYPLIEQYGGVVVGSKGGALYPAGTVIPPTKIDVYRPGPNNTIIKGGI
jgi:RHS repeat-associated protein